MRVLQLICLFALFESFSFNCFSQFPGNQPSPANPGLLPTIFNPDQGGKFYQSSVISPNKATARMAATTSAAFPLDACATYTFRMETGDAASDNHINDICGNYTGNSYQAGYTTINGNQQDALLQQLDINGQVLWSRTLGSSTLNERIQRVNQLPDGTLVMTGTIENPDGTGQHPFVAAADASGTLLWMRSIQTPTDYRGVYVVAASNGAIGMVAEDDATMLYARFDAAGNLVWLKKVQALLKSNVAGMVENNNWFIAYTGLDAGRRVGGVMVIDPANGNITKARQFGGPAVNTDFIFHSMEVVNLRPLITGIFSINNQPYQLFRVSASQASDFASAGYFETFNTPAISFDVTAVTAQSSWGETIAFKNSAANNDLYVIKTYGGFEESRAQIGWAKQFSNIGPYTLAAIDRVFDAGFLIANNGKATTSPYMPALSIKIDSAGLSSTGCEATNFDIEKIYSYNYPVQTISLTPVTMSFPVQPEMYTLQSSAINLAYPCKALNCPAKPIEDTCVSTFYRTYRSTHFCDMANDMSVNANNEVLVTGSMRDYPNGPETDKAILVNFDAKGKLAARKKIRLGNGTNMSKHYQTADGNVLILGNSSYNGKGYVTISKYTPSLNLLWYQAFEIMSPGGAEYQVLESIDGSIFVWYMDGNNVIAAAKLRLVKLDGSGNFLWAKNYSVNMGVGYQGSVCQDDQFLYTANEAITAGYNTLIMKIEKTTGNVVWSKIYKGPGNQTEFYDHIQLWQNKVLLSGISVNGSNSATVLMPIDKDGNIQSVNTYSYNNSYVANTPLVMHNNDIVLSGYIYDYSVPGYTGFISFLRVDPNFNILHNKRIYSDRPAGARNLKEATDGGLYEVGSQFYSNVYLVDFYLKKYTADGTMGNCHSENVAYTRSTINITASAVNIPVTTPTLSFSTLSYQEEDYSLQQNQLICSSPVSCLKPMLTGPQQICTAGNIIEYRAQRTPGCTAPVSWFTDPSLVKTISASDTLLKVQFIANGTSRIKAGVFSGCQLLQDSMDVTATIATIALDLGPDSNLCTGNTIHLNAHKGFASYTWQDASVDSLYTVTQPGDYYVTTTDGCGGLYSDTVHVLAAPPIPFDLGANQNMCSNGQISVTAPASFLNYSWSPNYYINTTTAQTAVLSPAIDTIYYVKAEKTPGCFAYDSIRIYVKQVVPVQLGNDTSFCTGYTLTVDAGNGFAQYKWSTGATSSSIPVHTTGKYSIITTDANNCLAYDTMQVKVYDNPVVKLPKDSLLCYGNNMKYDAGSGFAQYEWQDGSTNQQFIASAPGKYWVTITDQNKCTASDTAVINRIVAPPSAFLPPDTTICSYAKIELRPNEVFSQYLWSTAAITPSITVQQGGLYWLQVTDKYNCTGRDSLLLTAKKCLTGFFVPNAFTPHKDGRNDIFKPIILGTIIKYEFTIYNRWGQRVFQSASPRFGWDGTVSGNLQSTNTYVWTCTYQFDNGPVTFEKGTVTLVR